MSRKRLLAVCLAGVLLVLVTVSSAKATTYIVWGTYLHIFAQSEPESTANLVRTTKPLLGTQSHPWCGDGAYIRFEDKELFATALSASLIGKQVNLIFDDAAPAGTVAGHAYLSCKVLSIWW